MTDLHHFKIIVPDGHGVLGSIEIDGQPFRGVTFAHLSFGAKETATLTLQMIADVEIEGEADIVKEWRLQFAPHDYVAHEDASLLIQAWPAPRPVLGCDACARQATDA